MDLYEYRTVALNHFPDIEEKLNNLGRNGWELVSVITSPQLGNTKYALVGISISTVAVLKRRSCDDMKEENKNDR